MYSYQIKVPSNRVFIWGSETLNLDVVDLGNAQIIIRNDQFGEPVEIGKEPDIGGGGGKIAVLKPSETCCFLLKGCTGIYAKCTKNLSDSMVECVIIYQNA